ncbi:VOC family protein [Leptobacterium flavescens]|uniref:VOC family protein n=1 Tax=Leptobacterium flavescens TaxID=472055 RepID=A0A6P0UH69_9FLAO|nr:VOC family protein [Leptobacterium flavescens]NER12347.1 VOC family protein [Leptobacterium flavescens]
MKVDELILYSQSVEKQKLFYRDVLEMEIIRDSKESVSFKAGRSIISFEYRKDAKPIHYALNIPSYQDTEALEWLQKRVEVIPYQDQPIVDFRNWNAKALYFYDADRNIVEFIARKNLDIRSASPFAADKLLCVSEIGIATSNIKDVYDRLNSLRELPVFDGNFDRFCAAGDEEGLFILVDVKKKKWFPADDDVYLTDFRVKGDFNFEFKNGEIKEL